MVDSVTVECQECGVELAGDSPDLRLELTSDDAPVVYCVACFEREFCVEWQVRVGESRAPARA
jgi:hypothetical protein